MPLREHYAAGLRRNVRGLTVRRPVNRPNARRSRAPSPPFQSTRSECPLRQHQRDRRFNSDKRSRSFPTISTARRRGGNCGCWPRRVSRRGRSAGRDHQPARMLGLGDRIGTVEIGKIADLVVVREDPLVNLETAMAVAAVHDSGRRRADAQRVDGDPAVNSRTISLAVSHRPESGQILGPGNWNHGSQTGMAF